MQHYAPYGIPTPPASPSYDSPKCHGQQHVNRQFAAAPRYIPVAPEERLGSLLEGQLQLTEILGTGAYGVVYSAVDIKSGVRYAVKCLSKFNADGTPLERRQVAYQQREIRLHYLASAHSNVVSMLKIVDHPDCIYVILEYCPEGDLFLNITERGQYVGKDELAKKVFLQILDAVEHCHKLGIYHRDLKPENILVTDQGETVKLADFGLATSDDRSEDYGCGSTFYMSPECLDPSSRNPYYMCAPNDVWSLGVILVNLTCGRNPWKQASLQDSTYRAFARSPDFLKTILPLTDELNTILSRIFDPSPERRISLAQLRSMILACPGFTVPAVPVAVPVSRPVVPVTKPVQITEYVTSAASEEAIIDEYGYDDVPLSPVSTVSDEGSLTSSGSSIDGDEDFFQDRQDEIPRGFSPQTYIEPEDPVPQGGAAYFQTQEFVPQHYTGPVPVPSPVAVPHHQLPPQAPMHIQTPPPPPCQSKSYFQLMDMMKYVQQVPVMHQHHNQYQHHAPFQPVSFMPSMASFY